MRLLVLSINHRTAKVDMRERVAMDNVRLDNTISNFKNTIPGGEITIVSTCNRTEIYTAHNDNDKLTINHLYQILASTTNLNTSEIEQLSIHHQDNNVITHLFRVASGLESMVIGEPQILGQVKSAYDSATKNNLVGPTLHKVFQQAIAVAKRIRTETDISKGRLSVSSVAVDFAKQIFERFDDKTIVGIGAGEMAKLTLRYLNELNPKKLYLLNRSVDRANALAENLGLTPQQVTTRGLQDFDDLLIEADILLTSTGAPVPIITAERFKPLLKKRRSRPIFMIDIALPRDIDKSVGDLPNVYLYNIDDLQQVVDQTHEQRSEHVHECEAIVNQAVKTCVRELQNHEMGSLIRAFREQLHDIGESEKARTAAKLSAAKLEDLEQAIPQAIEEHTHRLINKILHLPLSKLRGQHDDTQIDNAAQYAQAMKELFDLEKRIAKLEQDEK